MDDGSRPTGPRVGLALIAKNEEHRLPTLLASVENVFDRVVLLDTGSTDRTLTVFRKWARAQAKATGMEWDDGKFKWCDDFAAARQAADALLMQEPVDWIMWADCDDIIQGAGSIRALAASAPPHVAAFLVDYDYARTEDGRCVQQLRRERIVRAGCGEWVGRVHEAQMITGGMIQPVAPDVLLYVHNKVGHTESSNDRNLRILHQWNEDDPDNPRVLSYLGVEHMIRGEFDEAIGYYDGYLRLKTGWDEERAQVHSRLASCLIAVGRFHDAITVALDAFRVRPSWPDTYLRLAEAHLALGENEKAEQWSRMALTVGPPEGTLLIVNPMDYTFQPRKVLAGALGNQGRVHDAMQVAREAQQFGMDESLQAAMQRWGGVAKRERTAETFAMCAEQLIGHDEQVKALTLLEECVPVFAKDHPKVVALRSMLRERLAWVDEPVEYSDHYTTGGSKPEDMIPDDMVNDLCERLPRTNFLLEGVLEQVGVE